MSNIINTCDDTYDLLKDHLGIDDQFSKELMTAQGNFNLMEALRIAVKDATLVRLIRQGEERIPGVTCDADDIHIADIAAVHRLADLMEKAGKIHLADLMESDVSDEFKTAKPFGALLDDVLKQVQEIALKKSLGVGTRDSGLAPGA